MWRLNISSECWVKHFFFLWEIHPANWKVAAKALVTSGTAENTIGGKSCWKSSECWSVNCHAIFGSHLALSEAAGGPAAQPPYLAPSKSLSMSHARYAEQNERRRGLHWGFSCFQFQEYIGPSKQRNSSNLRMLQSSWKWRVQSNICWMVKFRSSPLTTQSLYGRKLNMPVSLPTPIGLRI